MVPVLVYKRPYCYYELIFDFFLCHECLNTSLSAKRDAVHPGRTLAFCQTIFIQTCVIRCSNVLKYVMFAIDVCAVCSLSSL
jgi:hypothetical protein